MTYRLGVDLGTTFTAAAVLRGGLASMVSLGVRQPEMPSVVAIGDNELFVGDAAEHHGRTSPESVARFFKRRFGDSQPLVVRGQPWSAEALSARMLSQVLQQVEQVEGAAPSEVVLTHPAGWREFKVDAMHSVAQLAGLDSYFLVPEPVAAARHYAELNRMSPDAKLAVFDLGGGTFDTSVVATSGDSFTVVGTPRGVNRLGGIDLDEAVFAHVCDAVEFDPYDVEDTTEVRRAIWRLRRECRDAKEMLSTTMSATISVVLPGINTEVDLSRSDFEAMLAPVLDDAGQTVDSTIRSAGLTPDDIEAVLLVGGSSRIPAVRDFLSERFGRPVLVDTHPKHAVALGAARMEFAAPAAVAPPTPPVPAPPASAPEPPASAPQPPAAAPPAAAPEPPMPAAPQHPSSPRPAPPSTPAPVAPTPTPSQPAAAPVPQPVQASVPDPPPASTQIDGYSLGSVGSAPPATSRTAARGGSAGGSSRKPFFAVMAGFALLLVGGLGYATTLRDRNDGGDAALQVEESIAPSTSQLPNDTQDSAVIDEEDNASETPSTTETSEQPTTTESSNVEPLGDGSLGTVVVPAGESIQIRSIEAISGDVAFLGLPNQRGTELAIEHYGPIEGFNVDLGVPLDDLCSADGGDAGARIVLSDSQVVGVIGTSCSGAAVSASPLISDGGLVMISPSNTSPALTSDLAGNAGTNNEPGYHRTAHNDLLQAQALAHFAFNVLGHTTAAAIHDGDPYTQSLADTFALTFTNLGGEITSTAVVDREGTDMASVLAGIGEAQPQAIFMPIFDPAGSAAVQQIPTTSGLENASILTTDALLYDAFLEQPISEGIWISGPDLSYGTNQNQATQRRANEVVAEYVAAYGEAPSAQFWAHSYDATTLLLEAISQASRVEGDTLVIDRAGVR